MERGGGGIKLEDGRFELHLSYRFISRYRRHTESMKGIIEERVERIEKQWNSFVRSLMPSDLELLKTKKATVR